MMSRMVATALAAYAALPTVALALDPSLPTYEAVSGVSGQLKSVGSDTLVHEMELWADGFRTKYPGVFVTIEGKGSATAPPALLAGTAQFGPMSRLMTSKEAHAFEEKFGYEATAVRVAIDALAIYVNKDNPIQCLNLQQLDRIFSKPRKGSEAKSIDTWGEAGLSGEWAAKPISMYGRNTLSGTYAFFRQCCIRGSSRKQCASKLVPKLLCRRSRTTNLQSGIPASAIRLRACARFPLPLLGAIDVTTLPLKTPIRENILSLDTSISI
jgi:phosphate transport system substrate-binding protein